MNSEIKLHLACGKDDSRPIMQYIKITKQNCVATDSVVLAIVPTKLIFDSDFIQDIPKEGFLIHYMDYKKAIQYQKASWVNSNSLIEMTHNKKTSLLIKTFKESELGTFPAWENIVPSLKGFKKGVNSKIHINAEKLYRLQQSLGLKTSVLTFFEKHRVIEVGPIESKTNNVHGLIMQFPIDE